MIACLNFPAKFRVQGHQRLVADTITIRNPTLSSRLDKTLPS